MQDIRLLAIIAIRWLPLILVCAVVAGVIAYVYSSSQPDVYEATATLGVTPGQNPGMTDISVAETSMVRYADEAGSRLIAAEVAEKLGLEDDARSLSERISTDTSAETLEVAITARDRDPVAARQIALTAANLMIDRVSDRLITPQVEATDNSIRQIARLIRQQQRRLSNLQQKSPKTQDDRAEIIQLSALLASLRGQLESLRPSSSAFVSNLLEWRARPAIPTEPVEPRPRIWTLLALVVGGMLGASLAFVLDVLRPNERVRGIRDLEKATGMPALGSVSERRGDIRRGPTERLVVLRYPGSDAAEAYRGLLAKIGFASASARSLMVAAPDGSDSASVVAANTALAYAEAGRTTLLVDADYRSPQLHKLFGVVNERGLSSVLMDRNMPLGFATTPSPHPKLGLMLAGPQPSAKAEALSAPVLNVLLRRLLHAADVVVFASPSIRASLDATTLAGAVDECVLVVRAGARTNDVVDAASTVERSRVNFTGAVLYRQVRGAHPSRIAVKALKPPSTRAGWWGKSNPPPQIPAATAGAAPSADQGEREPVVIPVDGSGDASAGPMPSVPDAKSRRPLSTSSSGTAGSMPPHGPFLVPPPAAGRPPAGPPPPGLRPTGPRMAPSNGRPVVTPPPGLRGRPYDPARDGRLRSSMPGPYAIPQPEPTSSGNGAKAPHNEPTGLPG